jgi:DNA-binding CsgD family transcriptional regulator
MNKAKTASLEKVKDILELLNVSGRNNNCFFNSIFLLVKETNDGKWKSGSDLRKFLCDTFLQKATIKKTIKKFKTYLELVQFYMNDSMTNEDIARLLSVNVTEIKSLKKANIRKIDLDKEAEIVNLLDKHLKVSGRMPSGPEMDLAIDYIKNNYNIITLQIIIDHTILHIDLRHEMLGKVRIRVREKLENVMKETGSQRLFHSAKKYKYGIIITDNSHYQLLKINNQVLSTSAELSNFIASQETSFSFRQTNVRSRSSS